MQAGVRDGWPQPSTSRPWVLTGILAGITLLLVLAHPHVQRIFEPLEPLALNVSDTKGEMLVRWNVAHQAVKRADGATVEVHEGGKAVRLNLSGSEIRSGTFRYRRESNDVLLTLTLLRDRQPIAMAMVRSVGR